MNDLKQFKQDWSEQELPREERIFKENSWSSRAIVSALKEWAPIQTRMQLSKRWRDHKMLQN